MTSEFVKWQREAFLHHAPRVGVALLFVGQVAACPIVTGILTRPGFQPDSFPSRLLEISQALDKMFNDPGYDRLAARRNSAKALQVWMDLYLGYYLAPPDEFKKRPRWRELLDSVTGPLRRIQSYAQEENYLQGHRQVRLLQDTLTEFYGEPPARKAAHLGPVVHTLETLAFIPGHGSPETRERLARLSLLRDRFHLWMERWTEKQRQAEPFQRFEKGLTTLESLIRERQPEKIHRQLEAMQGLITPMVSGALTFQWGGEKEE
jgi:hypothetical protein